MDDSEQMRQLADIVHNERTEKAAAPLSEKLKALQEKKGYGKGTAYDDFVDNLRMAMPSYGAIQEIDFMIRPRLQELVDSVGSSRDPKTPSPVSLAFKLEEVLQSLRSDVKIFDKPAFHGSGRIVASFESTLVGAGLMDANDQIFKPEPRKPRNNDQPKEQASQTSKDELKKAQDLLVDAKKALPATDQGGSTPEGAALNRLLMALSAVINGDAVPPIQQSALKNYNDVLDGVRGKISDNPQALEAIDNAKQLLDNQQELIISSAAAVRPSRR